MITEKDLPYSYDLAQCYESTSGKPGAKLLDASLHEINQALSKQVCDNCKHDYCGCSVQDSILRADPEATFATFGCNSFTCK